MRTCDASASRPAARPRPAGTASAAGGRQSVAGEREPEEDARHGVVVRGEEDLLVRERERGEARRGHRAVLGERREDPCEAEPRGGLAEVARYVNGVPRPGAGAGERV